MNELANIPEDIDYKNSATEYIKRQAS